MEIAGLRSQSAIDNLRNEGILDEVHHTGDVMFDATMFARETAATQSDIIQRLNLQSKSFAVCTLHRSENTDDEARLRQIVDYIEATAEVDMIVFPIHPRTRQAFTRYGIEPKRLMMIEPLGYVDLHRLLASAAWVLTDSGGLQKEAYFHRVPCITLRDETEWVETIDAGWNRLWQQDDFVSPRTDIFDYGEGEAAQIIVSELISYLDREAQISN